MAYLVRYYLMDTSPRNTGIAVVFGEWPVRVLKHRGYTDARWIWTRGSTDEETAWIRGCHRFQALWYTKLDELLADEREVLIGSPEAFEKLSEYLRRAWERLFCQRTGLPIAATS